MLRNGTGRLSVSVHFRAVATLRAFMSETGKILPRCKSRLSGKSQRKLEKAVKLERRMVLLHPEPNRGLSLAEMREMAAEETEQEGGVKLKAGVRCMRHEARFYFSEFGRVGTSRRNVDEKYM